MKMLRNTIALCFCITFLMISCQDGGVGGTVASQLTGTYMSTSATVIVDNSVVIDTSVSYELMINEVDANTVLVSTEHSGAFEVDLEKSEDGVRTNGTTEAASVGFTFTYNVPEAMLIMKYSKGNVIINYEGVKQ